MEVVRCFEITHKISYFTTDNTGSNDTIITTFYKTILVEYGIRINPKYRQIRYLDHIINLCLYAFLFADNKTALQEILTQIITDEKKDDIYNLLIIKFISLKTKDKRKAKPDNFTK